MIRKKLIAGLLIALNLAACKEEGSREVVLATSPEGQEFHYMPIWEDGVNDITIMMAWPMTWAYEEGRNPAAPYVAAEAILSGGTTELAPREVMELFEDNNSYGHISVRADHAVGELTFPKEHTDEVVRIASEMLARPQFNEAWSERIKQNLLAGQEQARSLSATGMWQAARLRVLGESPLYSFLSLPDLTAIENVDTKSLVDWHRETITKAGLTVAVTGAISAKDAGKAVDRILADLPTGATSTVESIEANFTQGTVLLHDPKAEKTTLGIIGQLPPTTDGQDLTDLLAVQFFGRNGGPLFGAVRTGLRASYGLQVGFNNYNRDNRILVITGEIETEMLGEASELILATYEDYRTNPDLSGLDDLRSGIAHGTSENVEYVDVVANTILELALDGRDVTEAPSLGGKVNSILANDVAERMIEAFPSSDQLLVFAVSPDANALPGACVITEIEQVLSCP